MKFKKEDVLDMLNEILLDAEYLKSIVKMDVRDDAQFNPIMFQLELGWRALERTTTLVMAIANTEDSEGGHDD